MTKVLLSDDIKDTGHFYKKKNFNYTFLWGLKKKWETEIFLLCLSTWKYFVISEITEPGTYLDAYVFRKIE